MYCTLVNVIGAPNLFRPRLSTSISDSIAAVLFAKAKIKTTHLCQSFVARHLLIYF